MMTDLQRVGALRAGQTSPYQQSKTHKCKGRFHSPAPRKFLRRPTNETGRTECVLALRPARRTPRRRSKLFLARLALQPAVQAAQFRSKFLADLRILLNDVPDLWRSSYEAYSVLFESLALFPIQRFQF